MADTATNFDVQGARAAGYSDAEILDHIHETAKFDLKGARDAGYNDKEILSHLTGEDTKPSGVVAGLQQGAANVVHGAAETAKQFFGADPSTAEDAAKQVAPDNYRPAEIVGKDGHWYDPRTYNYSQIPQAVAEAAPGMAADLTAAKIGARVHPLVGVGAGLASYLLRTRGDAAKQDAVVRTGDQNAQPETQDKVRSLATGVAESIPQALGIGRFLPGANAIKKVGQAGVNAAGKKLIETALTEGGAGAASNAIGQVGATVGTPGGLKVDPAEVVGSGITSAATGGALAVPRGLADAHGAVKYSKFGGDNQAATEALMGRANKALDGDNVNTKTSYDALRTADEGVRDELKAAVKPVKAGLDSDTLDALKRASKGRTLSDSDLQTINDNTTPDVAFLARQAHVASLVKGLGDYGNGKFVGGVARHMENFLPNPLKMAAYGGIGALGVGPEHVIGLVPHSLPILGALGSTWGGLRIADKLTGNRVPLQGLLDRFSNPDAQTRLPAPEQPEAPQAPAVSPTGPKVPFNPGVAGGGTALALGQNPFAPKPELPAPPPMDANAVHEQIKGALRMAAARRAVAAQQAPPAPAGLDANALNEQVKSALLMAAARRKVQGQQNAEGLASESPLIQDNGGLDLLRNPAFGKNASALISAARAHAALTRQPEEEGQGGPAPVAPTPEAPVAPGGPPSSMVDILQRLGGGPEAPTPAPVDPLVQAAKTLTKITKKSGKEKVETPEPDLSAYQPMTDEQLYGKGMTDQTFAATELAKEKANGKNIRNEEGYKASIVHERTKRRNILAAIAGDSESPDHDPAAALLEELHHTRRRAQARAAIAHFTAKMSPEAADAVRKRLDQSYINGTWNE